MAGATLNLPEEPFSQEGVQLLDKTLREMRYKSWPEFQSYVPDYDSYCRFYGVVDLADTFYYGRGDYSFADQVVKQFPQEFIYHSMQLMAPSEGDPFTFIGRTFRKMAKDHQLNFESWWQKLKGFLHGSVIVDYDVNKIWLPFFAARPSELPNSLYQYSIAYGASSNANFDLKFPGIGGGFGVTSSVSTSFASGTQLSEGEQFQVEVMGLRLIREDSHGRQLESFSPVSVSGTKIVKSSHADYIPYGKKEYLTDFGIPHTHHGADSWIHTEIAQSHHDHFIVKSPLPIAATMQLRVDSESKTSFTISHQVKAGHRYLRKAIGRKAHDIKLVVEADV